MFNFLPYFRAYDLFEHFFEHLSEYLFEHFYDGHQVKGIAVKGEFVKGILFIGFFV